MSIDYIELLDQLALWLQNVDSQTLIGGIFSLLGATVLLSMLVRYLRGRRRDTVKAELKASGHQQAQHAPNSVVEPATESPQTPSHAHANESGGSLDLIVRQQRIIDNLAERVQALEGYLEMMSSRQQKSESGHRDRLYYQEAIRAAKSGASADELSEQYNLPAAEANLIISLSGRQARAA